MARQYDFRSFEEAVGIEIVGGKVTAKKDSSMCVAGYQFVTASEVEFARLLVERGFGFRAHVEFRLMDQGEELHFVPDFVLSQPYLFRENGESVLVRVVEIKTNGKLRGSRQRKKFEALKTMVLIPVSLYEGSPMPQSFVILSAKQISNFTKNGGLPFTPIDKVFTRANIWRWKNGEPPF